MREVPPELLHTPFHRDRAAELGVTSRMLEGARFVRLHPRVYRHRDHSMTFTDRVTAAALALPPHALTTGITRIQQVGLDHGPAVPLRFVVQGSLHLALDGIFLHRTVELPPGDGVGVVPAAAFVAHCARARTIDAIKVGDWLLAQEAMSLEEVAELVLTQEWRAGAREAAWVLGHLHPDSRSLKESEVRAVLEFAGLPEPEVNQGVDLQGSASALGDLWFPRWRTVVEYEGRHHQADRRQYVADIDRYALFRRHDVSYVQLTQEKLRSPRDVAREVHAVLVARGYGGPAPAFGERWEQLFLRLSRVAGRRRTPRLRAVS
jgi:hypothetical protein